MSDRAWKQFERRVAYFFHGKRCPVSDGFTRGDVKHDTLYIECKQRKRFALISLWDDTNKKAKIEGKTPVVCLSVKNRPGFWILVHNEDFMRL